MAKNKANPALIPKKHGNILSVRDNCFQYKYFYNRKIVVFEKNHRQIFVV